MAVMTLGREIWFQWHLYTRDRANDSFTLYFIIIFFGVWCVCVCVYSFSCWVVVLSNRFLFWKLKGSAYTTNDWIQGDKRERERALV